MGTPAGQDPPARRSAQQDRAGRPPVSEPVTHAEHVCRPERAFAVLRNAVVPLVRRRLAARRPLLSLAILCASLLASSCASVPADVPSAQRARYRELAGAIQTRRPFFNPHCGCWAYQGGLCSAAAARELHLAESDIPLLRSLGRTQDEQVARGVADLLGNLGAPAAAALAELVERPGDPGEVLRIGLFGERTVKLVCRANDRALTKNFLKAQPGTLIVVAVCLTAAVTSAAPPTSRPFMRRCHRRVFSSWRTTSRRRRRPRSGASSRRRA